MLVKIPTTFNRLNAFYESLTNFCILDDFIESDGKISPADPCFGTIENFLDEEPNQDSPVITFNLPEELEDYTRFIAAIELAQLYDSAFLYDYQISDLIETIEESDVLQLLNWTFLG